MARKFNEEEYNVEGFNIEGNDKESNEISFKNSDEVIAYLNKYSKKLKTVADKVKLFDELPEKYKKDKKVICEALNKVSHHIFETLSEDSRNDLEVVATYLYCNQKRPKWKEIPEEQLDKIKNPIGINEELSTNGYVAKVCTKFGFNNIPKEMWGNLNFIENIFKNYKNYNVPYEVDYYSVSMKEEILDKIISNDNVDNPKELIEIYKIIDKEYTIKDYSEIFLNNGLCNNPDFLLGFSEYKVNNSLEEMKHDLSIMGNEYYMTELREKANEQYGVCQWASSKLMNSNPRFLSEAINRGIAGFDRDHRGRRYEFLNNQDFLVDVACGVDMENENRDYNNIPDELFWILDDETLEYTKEQKRQAEEERKSRKDKEAMLKQLIQQNEELKERLAKIEALLEINKDGQAKEEQ